MGQRDCPPGPATGKCDRGTPVDLLVQPVASVGQPLNVPRESARKKSQAPCSPDFSKSPITEQVCVCLLLQYLLQSCSRGGGWEGGGHVLRETTSRGLCGLVCPSRTSELVPLVWESNRIITTIRRSGAHPGRGNASHRRPAPRQTTHWHRLTAQGKAAARRQASNVRPSHEPDSESEARPSESSWKNFLRPLPGPSAWSEKVAGRTCVTVTKTGMVRYRQETSEMAA